MTQQKNSRKGSAVWPMVLSWLSSLILALLAVFVMLFTTFGNVGYMQSCVKSSGYAQSAYDDMVQDFISYGAATGFDADVMTGFMSVDQVESDMQDAVAGLYAKTLTYYTRDNIAEAVYSAMEQATADRGITLEGETKTAVETVAEAVRMEYASYTAVPLVSQLRTLVQKLQKVMVIGLVVSAVLLCAAVVSMLHISRKDARLGARCLPLTTYYKMHCRERSISGLRAGIKSRLAAEMRLRAQRPLQMGGLLFANFQCVVRQGFGGAG